MSIPPARETPLPLPTRRHALVVVSGQEQFVELGRPLRELLPRKVGDVPVVAALVDRKATALSTAVTSACRVEPLTAASWEGRRIQRRSLALLALEAAHAIAPLLDVKVGAPLGVAQRILVPGLLGEDLREFGERLHQAMCDLASRRLPLRQERWAVDAAREYFSTHGAADAEELLSTWRSDAVPLVSYGSVLAIELGPLMPSTSNLGEFHMAVDDSLLLLVYGERTEASTRTTRTMPSIALTDVGESKPSGTRGRPGFLPATNGKVNTTGSLIVEEEKAWLAALGVASVGSFNRACVGRSVPELIRVSEAFQEKRITLIADEIQRRAHDVDIVCIAGPSSSGKTTFIRRLSVQLQVNGLRPVSLGLDDYYVDRDKNPRDSSGDFDFEALEALQLDLLHEQIDGLLRRETVTTPRYDFKLGKSQLRGGATLKLGARDVLLIEGIHGLNPALLGRLALDRAFRIFVSPLMQLGFDHLSRVHSSDVRLIRRIVRDRHRRGHVAAETIQRWPKVRDGERKHIYPHQPNADSVFDSALVYELSVLRVYAERYLLEVPRDNEAFTTAFRLIQLLDRFVSIYPDHVPRTSILREFIGGSGFEG